jgi:hypothetical protein
MKINKTVKRILIAFLALSSVFYILVFIIFLNLVGVVDINIKNKTDYLILWEWWWNRDDNGESVIDLAKVMPFEWDYFAVRRLGDEDDKITVNGKTYSLLQDEAVSFIKDDKVVFSEVWYKDDYTYQYFIKGSVHFIGDCSHVKKENAKFKAKKNESGYLMLEKIE